MDGGRFDALTRALTDAHSRRGALAAVLGGALSLLSWHGVEHVDAHNPLKKCKKMSGKAKKKCVKKAKAHNAAHTVPPPPPSGCTPRCERKICGDDSCGGSCGTCGVEQVCADGRCASSCPSGQKVCRDECIPNDDCCTFRDCPLATPSCCGGACVADLTSNAKHCGTCATDCTTLPHAARSTCSAGLCTLICDGGYAHCNTDGNDGCEVNTQTDATHCGTCTQVCGSGQVCHNSSCCTPNCTRKCGGASDGCGGTCTASCPECQTCSGGTCSNAADGTSCTFSMEGFPARGLCVTGTCQCKPNGAPCNCSDRPSAAGCCGHGCGTAPGGSSCSPNGICYQGRP
jgi:hypothetical protein